MYKIIKRILAFFLLIIMTLGFAGQSLVVVQAADTANTGQTSGRIKLEVYNGISKAPIAGVEFSVVDSMGKIIATPTTTALGNVTIDVSTGIYKVKQTKAPSGYYMSTTIQTLRVDRGTTARALFYNQEKTNKGGIKVYVFDEGGIIPLAGTEFLVLDSAGNSVGSLKTGTNGEASIVLPAGSYQLKEMKATEGYKSNSTISSLTVSPDKVTSVAFYNSKEQPATGSVIVHLYDSISGSALEGAEFAILDSTEKTIATFITNENGEGVVNVPIGSYRVKEIKAPSDYQLNLAMQSIKVEQNGETAVKFYNQKASSDMGQLKVNIYDGETGAGIKDVELLVTDHDGKVVATLLTNQLGEATVKLPAYHYQIKETRVPTGYSMNIAPQTFVIWREGITTVEFTNPHLQTEPGKFKVKLYDIIGEVPLAGGEFAVFDMAGNLVTSFVTDQAGEAATNLLPGSYQVKEVKSPEGYNVNAEVKSFNAWKNGSTTLTFYNQKIQPDAGNLTIKKYFSGGGPVGGAEFEIVDSTGKVVSRPKLNIYGELTITLMPGNYSVRDTRAVAAGIVEDSTKAVTIVKGETQQVVFKNSAL